MLKARGREALVFVSLAFGTSSSRASRKIMCAWKKLLGAESKLSLTSQSNAFWYYILSLCGANFHLACQAAFPRAIMYQVYTHTKIQSKTRSIAYTQPHCARHTAIHISKSADCKQIVAKFLKMKKGKRDCTTLLFAHFFWSISRRKC